MSPNSSLRRSLPVFLFLLAALAFPSPPVQAEPVFASSSVAGRVAVLGEGLFSWFRELFASVRQPGMTKEGVSIDPNGSPTKEGMSIDPNGQPQEGALSDEGMTIDPNG